LQGAGVGSGDDEMRRLPSSLEDHGIWVEHPLDWSLYIWGWSLLWVVWGDFGSRGSEKSTGNGLQGGDPRCLPTSIIYKEVSVERHTKNLLFTDSRYNLGRFSQSKWDVDKAYPRCIHPSIPPNVVGLLLM
jgi:hypothetical protein